MGFLRTIFILILIYYVVRFFSRYILPFFVRNYIRKNGGNHIFGEQRERNNSGKRKTGDVDIDYVSKKSKKVSRDMGEYVDFEEVKD